MHGGVRGRRLVTASYSIGKVFYGRLLNMEKVISKLVSPRFISSMLILFGALILWFGLKKLLGRYTGILERLGNLDGKYRTLSKVGIEVVRSVLFLLLVLILLQMNGVNVSSLIAGFGIASAIIGLALQDVLKDTIMGIHIITDHFYDIGDVVRYGDMEGVVVSFTMKTTKIESLTDHSVMTICNRNISEIVRSSNMICINIPLSFEENVKKVHSVLKEICERIEKIEGIEKCVYKGTQSFEDSAVLYRIHLFCPPERKPDMQREAMRVIQDGLDEADISIPYRSLNVRQKM